LVVLVQRRDLGAQLGQWRHEWSLCTEQMFIPGQDLPNRIQALGHHTTVRSELPRPANQRLHIDVQDARDVQ
jgi:hypothetical protein